jgi:hypothetical protein
MTSMPKGISAFEAVARDHLRNLEDAGGTPSDIVIELANVANAYAAGGLVDEAAVLREVVRAYQAGRIARSSPTIAASAQP